MSATRLTLQAPAKLNLFLHVTGRRADGYHELQTLFQLLDYGDSLDFESVDDGTLSLQVMPGPLSDAVPIHDNLILQAARSLLEWTGQTGLGARISLSKHLPLGAGLGGGSSDAASTLLALNTLWQLQLTTVQLSEIGLQLGADVPVFIQEKSAWGEGIGEQLLPVEPDPAWYLVVTPDCVVSTADIFSHEQLTRNSPAIKIADFLAGGARNDCEPITRMLYPQVDQAFKFLSQFGHTRMTGTGSSVFLSFPDKDSATEVGAKLPPDLQGFVAQGMNSRATE
ncbi:MAG: 4-(cytidine 5'-diphospho)-2-C-methyl-D-erythritol kinase [Gammaproteobacteria bacterium]|jgi:4-diphosphocytidyl-2-C-methyl-D-erythritol kinase|nr:4-(cytidine 5'-diphospho)-2-C-methyl-D-erythritol kinase [Gammaproteobacteria bacterium]HJN95797.1 4-(cytidine 5'-diphospho)-2-C-methyl-D-erythritol kinase [Gammaproteobacteria bacterium]|tara:strand:- start:3847 stop:4692 length:846 start_codon:yes stop_codon:yes gene_type:complete